MLRALCRTYRSHLEMQLSQRDRLQLSFGSLTLRGVTANFVSIVQESFAERIQFPPQERT